MKNGDPDEAPSEDVRKPSRVAGDPGPSRAAKVIGAAVGAIGAVAGAIGAAKASDDSGSAVPPSQEYLRYESTRANDAGPRQPGVISVEDMKAEMARAREAIDQDPVLRASLERHLREARLDEVIRDPADAQRSAPKEGDPLAAILDQLATPAFSATAGAVAVEILTAVKKELVSRVAKKAADLLLPPDDQTKPAGAIPAVAPAMPADASMTNQQLAEICQHLIEIIRIIDRGQTAPALS